MPNSARSARCEGSDVSARMPPCTFGCSVTTRWPRIAGHPGELGDVRDGNAVRGDLPPRATARQQPPTGRVQTLGEFGDSRLVVDRQRARWARRATVMLGQQGTREYRSAREQAQGAHPERLADRRRRRHRAGVRAVALVFLGGAGRGGGRLRCKWQEQRLRLSAHRRDPLAAHRRRRRRDDHAQDRRPAPRQSAVAACAARRHVARVRVDPHPPDHRPGRRRRGHGSQC